MHQPPLILLIDDDAQIQDLMKTQFEVAGFAFAGALNGPDGLAIAKEQKPDLILLDILMPGMSGGEVLGAMKADSELKGIPVIVLSSLLDRPGSVPLTSASGAVDFIRKDVDFQELLKRVMMALKM